MSRPQVRLDDDVAAELERTRGDRSLSQAANAKLRTALGLTPASTTSSEELRARAQSSVKAPTGLLGRRPLPGRGGTSHSGPM